MKAPKIRRGSCPRCNGRKVQHYVHGMPIFDAFADEDGNVPDWIHFAGCVIYPGPSFDRSCDRCGLRWNGWSDPRLVFSTWRELRTYLDVRFNDEMDAWLHENVAQGTRISRYPKLDDPQGKVDVWNGTAHRTLHFPFTQAEWESTLLEVYGEVRDSGRNGLDGAIVDNSSLNEAGPIEPIVSDPRFTTVFEDLEELLNLVDIDGVGDLETLLMFLFDRPIGVDVDWDDDGLASGLHVLVRGNEGDVGSAYHFPMSVLELVGLCASTVQDLGPYTRPDSFRTETHDVLGMNVDELLTALQQALGKVRIFNMVEDDH